MGINTPDDPEIEPNVYIEEVLMNNLDPSQLRIEDAEEETQKVLGELLLSDREKTYNALDQETVSLILHAINEHPARKFVKAAWQTPFLKIFFPSTEKFSMFALRRSFYE